MIGPSSQMISKQRAVLGTLSVLLLASCSIFAVRPAQEMSNMDVAIRAAKEVNADMLAPEIYRGALEKSLQAKKEYRFKNFLNARNLANEARDLAEKAEYQSIRNGAKREVAPEDPLAEPSYAPETTATPSVEGDAPPQPK
jgi:hypothetical protein